ncbi:MAG: prephenate dehydrogenase/arogenate dehydrogenase family protein [Methyloprofundus sp.]|nr:prephenate dehydrogenase/arogenate dehydrogenase family protein [Methyloprofundus sp.]
MFNKICIIGVGLIGGSIARSARLQGLCENFSAYGREQDLANLQRAKELGVVDTYSTNLALAVAGADCVIIATPVGAMPVIFAQLKPLWSEETLYMDAGSTKASVITALKQALAEVPRNFVPAHPIAGAENSGVDAARDDLYQGKRLILTPVKETAPEFIRKAEEFWQKIGSSVTSMDITQHDAVLAATSHLPHILAFSLVNFLGKKDETADIFKYAAGGFKDFTRIASSDPTMWLDICMANKEQIIPLIDQLCAELNGVKAKLEQEQSQELFDSFSYANQARQRFLELQ